MKIKNVWNNHLDTKTIIAKLGLIPPNVLRIWKVKNDVVTASCLRGERGKTAKKHFLNFNGATIVRCMEYDVKT